MMLDSILRKLCFLWSFWTVIKASDTGGFLFVAPKTLLSGSDKNLMCISFKNETSVAEVQVNILKQKEDVEISRIIEQVTKIDNGKKCFKLYIPATNTRNGRLQLMIHLKADGDFSINYTKQIFIQQNPDVTFIQTDKAVYTGGQLLQFRVFNLKSDLTAATKPIDKIWIENPNGIRLMQWLNESSHFGILNKTYLLSNEAIPGKWLIKLKKENRSEIEKTFLVKNYIPPRFSVTIKSQMYINTSGNISVCARYLFGKPVHGDLVLQYYIKCSFSYYCPEHESLATRYFRLGDDGCIHYEIMLKDLPNFARFLLINASVVEDGTGKKYEASHKIEIKTLRSYQNPEFSRETKKRKFKPGLPFVGEVVFHPQNLDSEKRVTVCIEINENRNCRQLITNHSVAEFLVLPSHIHDEKNFKAVLELEQLEKSSLKSDHTVRLNLLPWYSPSRSYVSVTRETQKPVTCGKTEAFNIIFTTSQPHILFHYIVKSRGVIYENGIIDGRSAKPFEYKESTNIINHGNLTEVKQLEFRLFVSPFWSPKAFLLVYYIRQDGEIIADTLALPVEKCLPNKVKTKWEQPVTSPGATNKLKIETSGNSICALTVSDKSMFLLSSSSDLTLDQILKNFDVDSTVVPSTLSSRCESQDAKLGFSTDKMDVLFGPKGMDSRFVDSLHAFVDFGALVITDLNLETRPCRGTTGRQILDAVVRNSRTNITEIENIMVLDLEQSPHDGISDSKEFFSSGEYRSFFPETWIWNLVSINDSGTKDFTFKIPDAITEWTTEVLCISSQNGLGIAQNSKLLTYKPFFLDFFVPHFLTRKEIFHLQVSVFNYESSELPVKITSNPSKNFILRSEDVVSYCIRSKSKIVHRFILEAVTIGEAEISITAEIDSSFLGRCGNFVSNERDVVIKKTNIRHEGILKEVISSGFVCSNTSSFDNHVQWNIRVPPEMIESSVSLKVFVSGDIFGPTLKNIDHLIKIPTGCGEQNMILLVPNILLLNYMVRSEFNDAEFFGKALRNLDLGYQKQLNFKLGDNSYSAFGDQDAQGSIWLTAFVVRYISQAKKYIHVDSKDLNLSVSWIVKQQLENGCFPVLGKVYHRNLEEKLLEEDSLKTLTAYILIALIESGVPTNDTVIKNAIYCLKPNRESLGLYGDLVSAYAFISAGEFRDAQALMLDLLKEAKRSYGMLWWDNGESIESAIEMTAYGILTLVKLGGPHFLAAASDALRWIIQYENQNGGFVSTQDTVVALEALSKFSASLPVTTENDNLFITAKTLEKSYNFNISRRNKMLQQSRNLPSFTTNIRFNVSGKGCALVQTHLQYNVKKGNSSEDLKIQLKINSVSNVDSNSIARFHICVRYDSPSDKISMAVLEVFMVSGYYPDRTSLYDIKTSRKGVRRWEEYEEKVVFYFEDLKKRKICLKFLIVREACIENSVPGLIKLYNYYNIEHQTTLKYNMNSICWNASWSNPIGSQKKKEAKRDLNDNPLEDTYPARNSIDNFVNVYHDLETPSGIEGVPPIYVMPPKSKGKGQHCPHCQESFPVFFSQLYCSSKTAVKVTVLKDDAVEFQMDVSPGKNFTVLKRSVSLIIEEICDCTILKSVNTEALLVVSPPRLYDVYKVEKIHADDFLQVYPWKNANMMLHYLGKNIKCQTWPNNY